MHVFNLVLQSNVGDEASVQARRITVVMESTCTNAACTRPPTALHDGTVMTG